MNEQGHETPNFLDKIEKRLSETPVNKTYLEGIAAGVHLVRALDFYEGHAYDRVVDLYQLYGQILQALRVVEGPKREDVKPVSNFASSRSDLLG